MNELKISNDTAMFEVSAVVDAKGKLTEPCIREAAGMMDRYGLVILTNLLSDEEADFGLELMRQTVNDPARHRSSFASETDNHYVRRDFCSLPSTPPVMRFAGTLSQRLEGVLSEFCGRSRPLLEIATFTSYWGSSHQYVHRDPSGVISLFAAVEDVSDQQGGTVFVPGTHMYGGAANRLGGQAYELMELFRTRTNAGIAIYNLKKLWRMRQDTRARLAPGEFLDRVFSVKWDQHQPNILRFALGKNAQFSLRDIGPATLWKLYRRRKTLAALFRPVQGHRARAR